MNSKLISLAAALFLGLQWISVSGAETNSLAPHWAFQRIGNPSPPEVANQAWPKTPIDRFILAKLEEHGLSPSPPASKLKLIRRATLDLTGLPPTPREIDDFLADDSPGAFSQVVERLLASPRHGERWGRHWLDVARYADSNGMDENLAYGNAWRYRDYVVASFHHDKPFDQFLREQLAGDLLSPTGSTNDYGRLIATGFLTVGPKMLAEDDPVKMEMDIIDEQLDTTSRAFMGLTVGCGRCHDHKYDPVPMSDYYALAGIFKSTRTMENFKVVARWQERPLASRAEVEHLAAGRKQIEAQNKVISGITGAANTNLLQEARGRAADYIAAAKMASAPNASTNYPPGILPELVRQWVEFLQKPPQLPEQGTEEFQKLLADPKGPFALPKNAENYFPPAVIAELKGAREKLKSLEQSLPVLPEAMAVSDGTVQDLKIHKRGSHLALGDTAMRGWLKSIGAPVPPPPGTNTSGRLQLADWLVHPEHPLTARVAVNRIWHWHFGEGLVRSPDNFGTLGEKPSHPELLDWLAQRFIESGWSMKALHRLILSSAVYQQRSREAEVGEPLAANVGHRSSIDPDNKLLSCFPRRRLEAEAIRDSILFISGGLEETPGGAPLSVSNRVYVTSTVSKLDASPYEKPVRSLYLPVIRSTLYDVFQVFDFADPSMLNGRRDQTIVAPQALFMMNGALVSNAARRLAESLLAEKNLDAAGRIQKLYRLTCGRQPAGRELSAASEYLERYAAAVVSDSSGVGGANSLNTSPDTPLPALSSPSERGEKVAQGREKSGSVPDREQDARLKSWQSLARSLMAASEFISLD